MRRRRKVVRVSAFAPPLVVLGVLGCGGEVLPTPGDQTVALAAASMRSRPWTPSDSQPVSVELQVPPAVGYGKVASIRVRLHNESTAPVTIGYDRRGAMEVLVARAGMRADSGAVWGIARPTGTPDVLIDPLLPGRDTTFEATWMATDDGGRLVPRGHYRVRAAVTAPLYNGRRLWTEWVPIEVK